MRRASAVALSLAVLLSAVPASAVQRFNVVLSGELVQLSGSNLIIGLPFTTGSTLLASWDVDLTNATRTALTPSGGTGTRAIFGGAISNGTIGLSSETAVVALLQNAISRGDILAVDNGSTPPPPGGGTPNRFDQLTLSDGVVGTSMGLIASYDLLSLTGDIPEGLFLSSLTFGRNVNAPTDPDLLSGTEIIDPFNVWQFGFPGPSPTFNLEFRQGIASTPQEFQALPATRFSLRNASVFLTELPSDIVPEPGSWAMLIAGFGLVGAAARRRRALGAAAI